MARYKTVEKWIDVDVDLEDFDDEDLLEEIESRGLGSFSRPEDRIDLFKQLYQLRRTGQDYQGVLDRLLYETLGKIV
jgi:hypothetical protein